MGEWKARQEDRLGVAEYVSLDSLYLWTVADKAKQEFGDK
jgi:hypothetical protein